MAAQLDQLRQVVRARPLHAALLAGGLVAVGVVVTWQLTETPEDAAAANGTATSVPSPERIGVPPDLSPRPTADPLPAFSELEAGPERKQAFIEYLTPVVRAINEEVAKRRAAVLALENKIAVGDALDAEEAEWLDRMILRYRVEPGDDAEQVADLKRRVDGIPPSLAVAQAALESNWGSSRFAREGNNLYGKWCFTAGCGIVPARRAEGATHEVEAYDDAADATRAYMHHLNSHPIYETLRDRRAAAREAGERPQGSDLAAGLVLYSAKGEEYVSMIRGVINTNELETLSVAGN